MTGKQDNSLINGLTINVCTSMKIWFSYWVYKMITWWVLIQNTDMMKYYVYNDMIITSFQRITAQAKIHYSIS